MRRELAQMVTSLESISLTPSPACFAAVESTLGRIAALDDPDCIGPLLLFLKDEESLDELMFSVVHAIELFDDDIYVDRILQALPALLRTSPRWAQILHMRILNSESTREAYGERYRRAEPNERAAAQSVLSGVCEWRPEFTDRVYATLNA